MVLSMQPPASVQEAEQQQQCRQQACQGHMANATQKAQKKHFNRLLARLNATVKRAAKAYCGADHKLFCCCLVSCAAVDDHRTLHALGTENSKVSTTSQTRGFVATVALVLLLF
jgi:hypothetical protein